MKEIEGLYKVINLREFRKTAGVRFDVLPNSLMPDVHSMDRVLHSGGANSPGSVGDVERPWYMHPYQSDNLMVLHGTRYVELYTPEHGKIEKFKVTPDIIKKGGEILAEGGAMLVWPVNVFHRIISGPEGSASLNLAVHHDGFDINTNFNIYNLNTDTGEYRVIREGFKDQKNIFD